MSELHDGTPVSFLETHQAWRDGEISTEEVLRIPRVPEVIGQVPNPETFSRTLDNGDIWSTSAHILHLLETGSLHMDAEEEYFEACQPTLEIIFRHAASLGIRPTSPDDFTMTHSVAASAQYRQQEAHLDMVWNGVRTSQAIYLATDRHPTHFLAGSFDIPPIDGEENMRRPLTKALEAQRAQAEVWTPEPYDIVAFDSTLPHAAPEMGNDASPRTFLRVWFAEKVPAPAL